jgi:cysteine synthase
MDRTLSRIGNTSLIQFSGVVPNNNRIWIKLECDNPFGSHYDRVYLRLFEHFERRGLLTPGCTVLETTSGSAGVSFAGIGRRLGYKCLVMIPAGGEKAREDAIRREGAELILTPADAYVPGFKKVLPRFLAKNRDVVFLNHSMGPFGAENRVAVDALGEIALELRPKLVTDYLVAAVGNGSSILGPGRVLKDQANLVAFESFSSGVAHGILYPGEYERTYGISPGTLPRHKLPGTSWPGMDFPHVRIAFTVERLVKDVVLVSDQRTDEQYHRATGRRVPRSVPRWDAHQLHPYGRTTRAGLSVALSIAERVQGKNIVLIAYDKEDRYDS